MNYKKNLLMVVLICTNIFFLFSNEKNKSDTNNKEIGINIGGSNYIYYRHQLFYTFIQEFETTNYYDYTVTPTKTWTTKEYNDPATTFYFLFFGPSFSLDFNFSFDYYFKSNKSVGFTFTLGYNFFYSMLSFKFGTNAGISRLLFRYKKEINTQYSYLYEMGILIEVDKYFSLSGNPILDDGGRSGGSGQSLENDKVLQEHKSEGVYYFYIPEISWGIGPTFLWGMSSIKNSYCFEFGGFLTALYGNTLVFPTPEDHALPIDLKNYNFIFQAGVFFRFNYNKRIKLR